MTDSELAAFGMPLVPWTLMSLAAPCVCPSGHPVFRQRPPLAAQALKPPASLQTHCPLPQICIHAATVSGHNTELHCSHSFRT